MIQELCNSRTVPKDLKKTLKKFTLQGFRTLALAGKQIANQNNLKSLTSKECEKDLEFIGLIILKNPLKKDAERCIKTLHHAGVGTVMITGDNLDTAVNVGFSCDILKNTHNLYRLNWNSENMSLESELIKSSNSEDEDKSSSDFHFEEFDENLFEYSYNKQHNKEALTQNNINEIELMDSIKEKQSDEYSNLLIAKSHSDFPKKGFLPNENTTNPASKLQTIKNIFAINNPNMKSISLSSPSPIFVMDGSTWSQALQASCLSPAILLRTKIFARTNPDQKTQIVKELMNVMSCSDNNDFVAFCGDGANDSSALKTAHVGLSLSQTEASIAAPFSVSKPELWSLIELLKEGKCSLSTAYQVFMFVSLTSVSQFLAVLVIFLFFTDFTNAHYYYMDLGFGFIFYLIIPRTEPYRYLTKHYPPNEIFNFRFVLRFFSAIFLFLLILLFSCYYVQTLPRFLPTNETATVHTFVADSFFFFIPNLFFLMILWFYMSSLFIIDQGPPFQEPIVSNKLLIFMALFNAALLLFLPFCNEFVNVTSNVVPSLFKIPYYYLVYLLNSTFKIKSYSFEMELLSCLAGIFVFVMSILFDLLVVSSIIRKWIQSKNRKMEKIRERILINNQWNLV